MTEKEKREQMIQGLNGLLRVAPFELEYRVRKKPKGVHVIIDVTKEQMEALAKDLIEKHRLIETDH